MITIYHNPRCRKSREALEVLKNSGLEHELRLYLQDTLSRQEITQLLEQLNMPAENLVRKGEAIWKDNYKGKSLSESDFVQALVEHPKLIQRPILATKGHAVVGRPIENVYSLLEKTKQH